MATEILRPRDCLTERVRVPPCRRRNFQYHAHPNATASNYHSNSTSSSNPRSNRKPAAGHRPDQKKRHQPEPSISKRSTSADDLRISRNHSHSLVMDKVTILRRGESLDSRIVAGGEATTASVMVANGTERIGPGPEVVPRQIRMPQAAYRKADVYAGSAFAVSPEPSDLPLPSFSKKKQVSVDDSATRDLRRLLRLDL
ncbi:hypothetical protein LINGRAHAP2_LOCUS6415 [Linum grandiflorum]